MKRELGVLAVIAIAAVALFTLSALATDAQMYFSSDKNGQNRVTNIQEGDEIRIVIIDNDENIDCDVRDKIWTDIKIMDPKTGAYIIWISYEDETGSPSGTLYGDPGYVPYKGHSPGNTAGWLGTDYLEETGADTGVFVSKRAFQVGTRESFSAGEPHLFTHVVDTLPLDDFQGGQYQYAANTGYADERGFWGGSGALTFHGRALSHGVVDADTTPPFGTGLDWRMPSEILNFGGKDLLIGRFENMDTLIGMYQDPNDATDVAIAMMKIIDVEATISWDQEIYKDCNGAATIVVVDPDENLNCSEVEAVPVFIIVNPGSWNPMDGQRAGDTEGGRSPTNFCMLKRTGGVEGDDGGVGCGGNLCPIRWYDIYTSKANFKSDGITAGAADGRFYIEYDPLLFATAEPYTVVSFYAWETGADTGVFQLNLNQICEDLGFDELNVRDVLVAYYLDPNDFDDFKLSAAYIEERQHSITSFTDANRADKDLYWIGRDPVYVQVIDANANVDPCCPEQVVVHICDPHGEDDSEWIILDETSSNSPVFFTFSGYQLWPVWDALGVGLVDAMGGFQLQLDNWKVEVFNEDEVYARYNDQYYGAPDVDYVTLYNDVRPGLAGLGDVNPATSFPPWITRPRVSNDVSFDLMSIADTQVWDGTTTTMYFLDRQGNRVSGYVNSDCVFIEVIDPDQDEDQYRRERIDAYWDGGQSIPFGPQALNEFVCEFEPECEHVVNHLLGDTNIFNDSPVDSLDGQCTVGVHDDPPDEGEGWAKLYVLNPRNGRWAAVDLLETGVATGDFVSVICIDLVDVYECVPTLGVVPGDTIVAFYQDPSNHSDNAMISLKVGIGGGGTPPTQQSTAMFVDADGNDVANYTDADLAYVKVIDPSHTGAALLANAVEIDGDEYDLTPFGAADTFITEALDLGLEAGDTVTATYTDPTDSTDTSFDEITVIASVLSIDSFYAGPNPFETEVTFGFNGTGVASTMSVAVYDLAGGVVYETTQTDVTEITWDGAGLANGAYIYMITATDGTNTFSGNGKVFINR
ncbi:T9SS type A sorting domain-containing protein [Candidatus Bipolaricaulota bacterium]